MRKSCLRNGQLDSPDFRHQYVLARSDLSEILQRALVDIYRSGIEYSLHVYPTIAEYEERIRPEKQTKIERQLIVNPEDFD